MLSVFKYVCDFAVSDSSVILPPHVGFECDNVVSSGRPWSRVKACLALETGQTLPSVGQPQHYTPRCSSPHFWSVTLIITYQHKHLHNYLRPGGVFCVSHPCRHLPGFSGCGGDDMKRARRLCVCARGSTTRCQAAPAVCRTPAVFWHVGAQTNNATAHILLFLSYLQLWFPFSWVMQAQDSMSTAESLARHVTSSLAGVCLTRQKGPQR